MLSACCLHVVRMLSARMLSATCSLLQSTLATCSVQAITQTQALHLSERQINFL